MTSHTKIQAASGLTPRDLALAGYGAPLAAQGEDCVVARTSVNATIRRQDPTADTPIELRIYDASVGTFHRISGETVSVHMSGDTHEYPKFAYDMIRRAAATADGNGFYGPYGDVDPEMDDSAIQYAREADQAILALGGLNLVAEDLVGAALLSRAARDSLAANEAYDSAGGDRDAIASLIRVVARILMNSGDTSNGVQHNMTAFTTGLKGLIDDTLAVVPRIE